jgi:hypothetical protein
MASDFERELQRLEVELKQLESDYTMFFSGRLPRLPLAARRRVQALVTQYDRRTIGKTIEKFRFSTIQARYAALSDLWDRALRAREEGRPGPFAQQRPAASEGAVKSRE